MGREKRRDIDLLVDGPRMMLCAEECHPLCKSDPKEAMRRGLIASRHTSAQLELERAQAREIEGR